MQFKVVALFAALASVAAADYGYETVTVYACPSSSSSGYASSTIGTVGSTGVVSSPTATGSPITYATGAASVQGVSALGLGVAAVVALFI